MAQYETEYLKLKEIAHSLTVTFRPHGATALTKRIMKVPL